MSKIIIGLGNPGENYINTRHNVGFIYLDLLAEKLGMSWAFEKKFKAQIAKNGDYILVKPQTYMNLSGDTVAKVINYFGTGVEEMLVVHDDIDLEVNTYKLQRGRGSAGHNGVQDIMDKLKTNEFWRLRIGVGRPEDARIPEEKYVLGRLSKEEIEFIRTLIALAIE